MTQRFKLADVAALRERQVFFDANILIYLFWPTGQQFFEDNYARVFNNLRKSGNELFVSFSVVSEVVNRIIRIEHGKYKENTRNKIRFKPYRNSPEGEEALSDIYLIFRETILPQFEFIPQEFNKEDVEDFLYYDELDFNDKAIQNICQQNDFVLLTNDIDFRESSVDIISGHPAYFK